MNAKLFAKSDLNSYTFTIQSIEDSGKSLMAIKFINMLKMK